MTSSLTRAAKNLIIAVLAIFWLFFIPTLVLLFSPLYLWRQFVSIYAKKCRKDLGKMVPARSCILAVDNMLKPECNVVIWFALENTVTVPEFQQFFTRNVLNLENSSDQSLVYPEFRQYFHHAMGYLFWKWDEDFKIQNHVEECAEFVKFKGPVLETDVLKLNEKLLSKPWPERRSPWKFLLINNYETKSTPQTLLLFTLHHGMGDGYSFLKLIQNHMVGEVRGKTAKPKVTNSTGNIWSFISLPFKIAYEFSEQAVSYDFNEWHLAGRELTHEVRVGKTKRIPVTFIKEIKRKYSVSFSAVLSAATAGGIRKYFIEHGIPVPESMRVFLPLPFPNHPDDKLITHLTGCYYKLPIGEASPRKRIEAAHKNFESLRGSLMPLVNYYLCLLGGALPTSMFAINKNYHCTGIFSNFPGDEETELRMMDRKLQEFSYNVGYLHGCTGFTITCLTFQSNLRIDLAIDTALAPTKGCAKEIVDNIADELEVLWGADSAKEAELLLL